MESSIIEHLRLQEGRLFQNEAVLALFLDVKAVVIEALLKALRSDEAEKSLIELINFSDTVSDQMETSLETLAPRGLNGYHIKSLSECVKTVSKLLWPSELLLVARPKLSTLLRGMCKRLATSPIITSFEFLKLDPIKQDFVIREAFRRSLVNDCLVIFDDEPELKLDVGPEDSASQVGGAAINFDKRPIGARSVIGASLESLSEHGSEVSGFQRPASVAPLPRMESFREGDDAKTSSRSDARTTMSVMPKVVTAMAESVSRLSNSSGATATSIMRRPFNVRKIHVEEST